MRRETLLIYRDFENGQFFEDMARLMEQEQRGDFGELERDRAKEDALERLYRCMHGLLEMAGRFGFYGNLWHCYLADLLVNHENSYSCACECRGRIAGTVNEAVLHDLAFFKELFSYDFATLAKKLGTGDFGLVEDYEGSQGGRVYNTRIRDRVCTLAKDLSKAQSAREMKDILTDFYRDYGVGKFGLHKAFRVLEEQGEVRIEPIGNIAHVKMADLVGYELQKQKLIDNTEAFVGGRKANNCLLFGDAGTGKSSSIKAIANEYYAKGLRIIEIYKHQFRALHDVVAQIKNRNYKFILYLDDLSFEEFEVEYKYLKAVIEGGLERKPENVLIYATSNRRHLVRESFKDKQERDEELHVSDTVQEKLSLSARFGVTIYFGSPDQKQFQEIVEVLAQRAGVALPKEKLFLLANQWELSHGGLSGRTAQQFIDYLAGTV